MKSITLTLPFPPSTNRIWRSAGAGKVYLSSEYKQFKNAVQLEVMNQIGCCPDFIFNGFVHAEIVLYPDSRRKYDIDNRIKSLFDSLTKANVWKDDSQVKSLYVYEGDIQKKSFSQVTIRSLK